MQVQHYYLVGVSEETKLLVSHLHCAVMHACKVFDNAVQLFCAILYVWISHLNWLQQIGLLLQLFFLRLEILYAIR